MARLVMEENTVYLGKKSELAPVVEENVSPIDSSERPKFSGAAIEDSTQETLPIARYLGINDRPSSEEVNKLSYIVGWLKSLGISDSGEMIAKIRSEEIKLGEPTLSEKRINVLYRVLRLNSDIDSKVKELMAYTKGLNV